MWSFYSFWIREVWWIGVFPRLCPLSTVIFCSGWLKSFCRAYSFTVVTICVQGSINKQLGTKVGWFSLVRLDDVCVEELNDLSGTAFEEVLNNWQYNPHPFFFELRPCFDWVKSVLVYIRLFWLAVQEIGNESLFDLPNIEATNEIVWRANNKCCNSGTYFTYNYLCSSDVCIYFSYFWLVCDILMSVL